MKKRASQIAIGDYLINLGFVSSIRVYNTITELTCTHSVSPDIIVITFGNDTLLTIDITKVSDQ